MGLQSNGRSKLPKERVRKKGREKERKKNHKEKRGRKSWKKIMSISASELGCYCGHVGELS